MDELSIAPWSFEGMKPRRDMLFSRIRESVRLFLEEDASWREGVSGRHDPRVYVQVCLPLLQGTDEDQQLARRLLEDDVVKARVNHCSFTTEYLMAVIHGMGDTMPPDLLQLLKSRIADGLLNYAKKDLQHHGYNDNHVTLATSSLILGGQLVGNEEAIEQGRYNLLNFRDTFLRRGFMHETNDCYIPHTLYSTAIVAEFAKDPEIKELARNCEARIWADWIGHWHLNLCRKPGPSARDYTYGRLNPMAQNAALWTVFGDEFPCQLFPIDNIFKTELPDDQTFTHYTKGDMFWNLGFLARICAHGYHIPESVAKLAYHRDYPYTISGTHEVGHFDESVEYEITDGHQGSHLIRKTIENALPFPAREIYTYQYQELDWAMGTASQRMIGNCPNNNWGIYYRKTNPLLASRNQGMVFCSYSINDKRVTGSHDFEMIKGVPAATNREDFVHWFDNGRYAGMQHEGTAIMLYRPRIHERHKISSLATALVFPLTFGNEVDQLHLGDTDIKDFQGESTEACNIYLQDGFVYVGIRPLLNRQQSAPVRIKASKENHCGLIDIYSYSGAEVSLEELDIARIGGGFLCEVRSRDDFDDLEAFKSWFEQGQILDDQAFFMRQVRYHRPGLDMGLRWDMWGDNIMYRTLNGRELERTKFSCSQLSAESLPWLTGDVSGLDHFNWAVKQSQRQFADKCTEPGRLTDKNVL